MDQASSVIVLEFNELAPRLMTRWINEGLLPGFKRLFEESRAYITDAEEDSPQLEPWIQWVTVHTGLRFAEHGVFDLGDGHKLSAPRIWDHVSDAGGSVWVCGSMNAGSSGRSLQGAILPDPWSVGFAPYPKGAFAPFFKLVRTYVQEYTREKVPLSKREYAAFGLFVLRNGLSLTTLWKTAQQLVGERLSGGTTKWKRAMILDRLMWDLFRSQWQKSKPNYATIFLNSTAHLQHYYWRAMEPDAFQLKPSAQEVEVYGDAIFEGYRAMDELVQEALALVEGSNTTLVLLTALSQQPLTAHETTGGKQVFHARDPLALLRFSGATDEARYSPVMAEEYRLYFESEAAAERALAALESLRMGDVPVMRARRDGSELYVACGIYRKPASSAQVTAGVTGKTAGFHELFFAPESIKSGGHHRDGLFWVRTVERAHSVSAQKVPLSNVAPLLARLAGLTDDAIALAFPPGSLRLAAAAE